jgi:replicative DNA helicase
MFIYRDDYYNKESESLNQTEVIIAKNRDGRTGMIRLYSDPGTHKYMPMVNREF